MGLDLTAARKPPASRRRSPTHRSVPRPRPRRRRSPPRRTRPSPRRHRRTTPCRRPHHRVPATSEQARRRRPEAPEQCTPKAVSGSTGRSAVSGAVVLTSCYRRTAAYDARSCTGDRPRGRCRPRRCDRGRRPGEHGDDGRDRSPHARIRLPRHLHPGAWWLWSLGLAAAAESYDEPDRAPSHRGRRRVRRRRTARGRAVGEVLPGVPAAGSSSSDSGS